MKQIFLSVLALIAIGSVEAQTYPEPEFANEVYFLKKDSTYSAVRLEKIISTLDSKTKLGGFGGYESGFEIDGTKSRIRLRSGSALSFIISKGIIAKTTRPTEADSMMIAAGIDPSNTSGMMDAMNSMNDPTNTINLYKIESEKGKRKVLLQKTGGAVPFASKKMKSSVKYSYSVKKIREGYWELVIDKSLPTGEYAFSKYDTSGGNGVTQTCLIFAFGID